MSLQPVSLKKKKKRVREKGGGGEAGEISSGQHNKPPADIQRMGTGTDAADTHVRAHTHKCTMHFNCQRSHAKVQIVMQKHKKKKKNLDAWCTRRQLDWEKTRAHTPTTVEGFPQ